MVKKVNSKRTAGKRKSSVKEPIGFQLTEKEKAEEVLVDQDLIQSRAYQIYQEKGGDALDNWLEAERVLREEIVKSYS